MTPLKTGAIALTLIIIIPIMLGYAMATEDVEQTVETTENAENLSSIVLNSTSPYYIPYTGANNNGKLYRVFSDGVSLENPDYVSTSSTTYSFMPVYADSTQTISLDVTSESITYTSSDGGSLGIGDGTNTPDVGLPDFLTAKMTIDNGYGSAGFTPLTIHIAGVGYDSISMYPGDVVYITSHQTDGSTYYRLYSSRFSSDYDFSGEYVVDYIYILLGGVTFEYVDEYTTLSISDDPWSATVSDYLSFEIVTDGSTFSHSFIDSVGLLYSDGTMTLSNDSQGNITYSDVTQISIALMPDVTTFTYENSGTEVETYADITEGWRIPTYSGTYTDYWFNGYDNYSIRMMLHIEAGESFGIYGVSTAYLSVDSDSNGLVTVTFDGETETLGAYTDVMLDIGVRDAVTKYGTVVASGLAEWPTFGENPDTVYNSVTLESSNYFTGPFEQLKIAGSNTVEIRVDSANIIGGYFASTNGYFYWPFSLFPDDETQGIVIDSVGIYGDALTIGGVQIALTDDNQILIADADTSELLYVDVLGLTVDFIDHGDNTWTSYVDGHRVAEHISEPAVGFVGDWSLTLHRTVTTESTITTTEWQAGEFAFTQDDFVLCMILSTVLVFVGLGLMRGVKIGVLAVVCSAAGIIAFMIA